MDIPKIVSQYKGMKAAEAARHYQTHFTGSTSLELKAALLAAFGKEHPGKEHLIKTGAEIQMIDLEVVAKNNQREVRASFRRPKKFFGNRKHSLKAKRNPLLPQQQIPHSVPILFPLTERNPTISVR